MLHDAAVSQPPGGEDNLTCPWYGVVPFFRVPFHDKVRIYRCGFQQFFAFSGFIGIVFRTNSFIGELFWHFRIYGYEFQKICQIYGYTFEKSGTSTI